MSHDNMDGDIRKLLTLLRKILKNHPQGSDQAAQFLDQKAFNLNLCIFTLIPMASEEWEDFEEMYHELFKTEGSFLNREDPSLEFKLNSEDMDFLKKNGICF